MEKTTITTDLQEWKEMVSKCKKFADLQINKSDEIYKKRNPGVSTETIKDNILIGKLAELVFYKFISSDKKLQTKPPDFTIHQGLHDPDVTHDNIKYHIKACRYDTFNKTHSWVYQKTACYLFLDKHVFVIINASQCECEFYIVDGNDLVGLYKPTIKENESKIAIYEQDIK